MLVKYQKEQMTVRMAVRILLLCFCTVEITFSAMPITAVSTLEKRTNPGAAL